MIKPELEFVFEATGRLGAPVSVGPTPDGTRRIVPILSGPIKGPLLQGELEGHGADWQLVRPDGVTVADALYAIRTHDGTVIQVRNKGLRHGPAEVIQRLAAGEEVDPSSYYFRTVPEFIAPLGPYEWLNQSIFLCSGARSADGIRLWFWRVL